MGRQPAANVDPILFNEILIRPDRGELQRLVKLGRDPRGFEIVEDKIHT